ncbi:unnamed protein product [Rotaria sp. Silwood2]|nr:unnamed protein product [Rotaria sp. Silwood2]CAF4613777.1 unnamed protein product [Rotaria sp. Silwood2]CAF4621061.1 unnamed protein product [Rotaria sp. Silwood2]
MLEKEFDFLNEKQQQSNSISRYCKVYNIKLQDKLSSFVNQLEETTNSNTLDLYVSENSDHDLTVITEGKNNEVIRNESSISIPYSHPVIRQNA